MLSLRSATSALLLRTGTQIATVRTVPRVRSSPIRLCASPPIRALSLSGCLCEKKKKKKRSAWLEMTGGQNMDSNIEEVLAPLRLAVKEQVMKDNNKLCNMLHYYLT